MIITDKELKYVVSVAGSDLDGELVKFILEVPECSIYYHPDWLNILKEETNQEIIKLICRDEHNRIVGFLPLQFTKGVPFGIGGAPAAKRLSSLPRSPVGGPISICDEVSDLLLHKAIDIINDYSDSQLQIKSFNDNLDTKIGILSKYFWRETYFTDIPPYPEEIRFGNSKNHAKIKRAINKASKNGVKLRFADSEIDLSIWYALYLDTMKFHKVPPRSIDFFKNLWHNLKPKGLMQLVLAELEDGDEIRVIAGSIFFYFNKTVIYAFNGSNRKDFDLRPNDLIHWTIIHDSQKKGYEVYDLGEVANGQAGLAAYKQKWSTRTLKMFHYYYPDFPEKKEKDFDSNTEGVLVKKIWSLLPLKITAVIGREIYKYL